jgi:hypothetical protein
MKSSLNCGIKGAYKVDLYKGAGKNREFVETTEWFDNDITNVGLNYPYYYPFASCFMFLSLGSGAGGNNGNRQNSTGLNLPNKGFPVFSNIYTGVPPAGYPTGTYIQSGQYIGWQGYEIGGVHNGGNSTTSLAQSTCGTKFTPSGINFYRGWTIPTGAQPTEGAETIADPNGLVIQGLMVSPSSGTDATGKYAFSLVDRSITIPSGYTATITYNLSLNFQDYANSYTFFSGIYGGANGYFNTGNAYSGINNSELSLLSGWSKLSGFYRMLFPGINFVNYWGGVESSSDRGNELEPYIIQCLKTCFYLSPDIAQFAVNKFGPQNPTYLTGESQAYNSNGLAGNYFESVSTAQNNGQDASLQLDSDATAGTVFGTPNDYYYNIKSLAQTAKIYPNLPAKNIRLTNTTDIANYSGSVATGSNGSALFYNKTFLNARSASIDFATPGKNGFNDSLYPNYGNISVYSSMLRRTPIPVGGVLANTGTSDANPKRDKKITKSALFSPIQSLGYNSRFSSLTLGYGLPQINSIPSIYPYVDFLFLDSSGRAADMPHYRLIPDIYLTNRGTGVAQAIFSITGSDGKQINSANRFSKAYAFMGTGVDYNSSGIDIINNSMINSNSILDTNSSFVPPGAKPTGYLFPGQVINSNVSGSNSFNNYTGWGAVYGVVGSSGFYQSLYDACLIDYAAKPWQNGNWSGFSGDNGLNSYPNETGDQSKLFWPIKQSGIGLAISGMQYYSPYFNTILSDPNDDYVIKSGAQYLFDVTGSNGASLIGTASVFSAVFQSGTKGITIASLGNPITGYALRYPSFAALTGSGLNAIQISAFNSGSYNISPTRWSKPSGVIHHVESLKIGSSQTGYRLLPNYALPNNNQVNNYSPVIGGAYPALSMQNGLQVYFDFIWSGA